jgi:tetratricopeptide (TPR) repeat protein
MSPAVEAAPPTPADLADRAAHEERRGHWDAAGELFARAFREALAAGSLEAAADALRGQARVRKDAGRFAEAEELAELSREIARRNGLVRSAARATNVLALTRHAQRDWDGARALYEEALDLALQIGDDDLIGLACLNLGVLANLGGSFHDARVRYLESIGSSVRSGNKRTEVMAYNNLGMVCADQEEWMEADLYFDRGIEIAERTGDAPQLARLCANRAEPLLHVGEVGRARASVERAAEIAGRIAFPELLVEVARYRGMVERAEGDIVTAEAHMRESARIALCAELELERADALRELGTLLAATARPDEAREVLSDAVEIFTGIGAVVDARRVRALLVELGAAPRSAASGDPAPADL